jgi:hypothetical protein
MEAGAMDCAPTMATSVGAQFIAPDGVTASTDASGVGEQKAEQAEAGELQPADRVGAGPTGRHADDWQWC